MRPNLASQQSLTKWLDMTAENDFRDLPSIIAADAVFRSPVGLKPYPGRDLVCLLLGTAGRIYDGENAALEFSAQIGDVELKAVDLIRLNAVAEITEFERLVRPTEGAKALGNAIGALIGPQVKAARAAGSPR